MLSRNSYEDEYVEYCRAQLERQVAAYKELLAAAREGAKGSGDRLDAAALAFEVQFFNGLVLLLDNYFCHRSRTLELKDGNPLNEVRVICNSLMNNGGVMAAEKSIKLKAEKSILKYEVGDEIKLNETDFKALAEGFFIEIKSKYSA